MIKAFTNASFMGKIGIIIFLLILIIGIYDTYLNKTLIRIEILDVEDLNKFRIKKVDFLGKPRKKIISKLEMSKFPNFLKNLIIFFLNEEWFIYLSKVDDFRGYESREKEYVKILNTLKTEYIGKTLYMKYDYTGDNFRHMNKAKDYKQLAINLFEKFDYKVSNNKKYKFYNLIYIDKWQKIKVNNQIIDEYGAEIAPYYKNNKKLFSKKEKEDKVKSKQNKDYFDDELYSVSTKEKMVENLEKIDRDNIIESEE